MNSEQITILAKATKMLRASRLLAPGEPLDASLCKPFYDGEISEATWKAIEEESQMDPELQTPKETAAFFDRQEEETRNVLRDILTAKVVQRTQRVLDLIGDFSDPL